MPAMVRRSLLTFLFLHLSVHLPAAAAEEACDAAPEGQEEPDEIAALQHSTVRLTKPGSPDTAPEPPVAAQAPKNLSQVPAPSANRTGPPAVEALLAISPEEKEIWLQETNVYRCMHGTDMVTWDDAVYQNAQQYVNGLTSMKHSNPYQIPPPAGPAGENLASGQPSIQRVVQDWYEEVNCCEHLPGCATSTGGHGCATTGHFTALVWAGVKKIGCAKNSRKIYICRYWSGPYVDKDSANMRGYHVENVPAKTKSEQQCRQELGVQDRTGGVAVEPPSPPNSWPLPQATACTDTRSWKSRLVGGCEAFEKNGWCGAGKYFRGGYMFNYPEKNCCVCGGGKK